jgi:hypothetical protein
MSRHFDVQTNTAQNSSVRPHRGPVDHRAKRMLRRKGTPYGHFPCIQAPFPAEPVPRVPQHPPDEMPDEGATTGTSHHARLQARASASAANSCAPALDDEQARRPRLLLLDKGSPLQCQHDAHGSPGGPTRDHWFLPAIRATTHVEGKASGSSRRRTPAARPEQARAGPALGALASGRKRAQGRDAVSSPAPWMPVGPAPCFWREAGSGRTSHEVIKIVESGSLPVGASSAWELGTNGNAASVSS